MDKNKQQELRKALKELGYMNGMVKINHISFDRVEVTFNGKKIGIYDFNRKTFVD